jgi:hypothetical protein
MGSDKEQLGETIWENIYTVFAEVENYIMMWKLNAVVEGCDFVFVYARYNFFLWHPFLMLPI